MLNIYALNTFIKKLMKVFNKLYIIIDYNYKFIKMSELKDSHQAKIVGFKCLIMYVHFACMHILSNISK